jgi:cysteine desulfurase family protein
MERLYLDNAATSFPKPPAVHAAMLDYCTRIGASPGRGSYAESLEGASLITRCRERIARLFHAPSPDHVVFTLNTSDALNLAIKGMVAHARTTNATATELHIVTTAMDHNSILRPLNALAADRQSPPVTWTCVDADPATGLVDPEAIRAAIRPSTILLAVIHGSNAMGTLQPIERFASVAAEAGVPILVDAAQTAGRVPIDVEAIGIDLLACPGHKGLLGPLGTGCLIIRPGMEDRIAPLREGGTGSASEHDIQPMTMPDRYEPGSHNTPGIVGLSEGIAWLLERGVGSLWETERALIEHITNALRDRERFAGLRLLGPQGVDNRIGVFTFVHDGADPAEVAAVLESAFGVLVRAGVHCAPRAHGTFGTRESGGGVRLSIGAFTTRAECDRALDALAEVCAAFAAN